MGVRGPKSGAEMAAAPYTPEAERPEPPQALGEAEADVWKSVVGSMPADWFGPETHPILVDYCRHAVRAELLAEALEERDEFTFKHDSKLDRYAKLVKLADTETRAMLSCARSMRITQQAQYDAAKASRKAKRESGGSKPWEA